MRGRVLAAVVGLGLVFSVVAATPATAAPKKRPDLVVAAVSASPATVAVGGQLTVRDTTRNKGRKAARKSFTRYVLSKNTVLDKGDIALRDRKVKRLKPGKRQASKALTVRIPAKTKPGAYWLLACADARKQVSESHERNNCRAARRLTIAKKVAWPRDGAVQVRVSAQVDVAYRYRSESVGFETVENEDVRLIGDGTGWLSIRNGKPDTLTWFWSKASVSGTEVYDAEGETDTACRWDAYAKITGSAALDVKPHGHPAAGQIDFPSSQNGSRAAFGLEHEIKSVPTPRVRCDGTQLGAVSPVPTLQLRQYWWFKKPTYTIDWSKDYSSVTWRQRGDQHSESGGGGTEDQSYQADGRLTITPLP